MKSKTALLVFSFATLLMSCTNDDPTTLIEDAAPIMGTTTYNQNVKSIIDNNCVSCHAAVPRNGAPMALVTYDQVKEAVLNRELLNRVSLENGNSSLMPRGGRMPQATIDIIMKWNQEGLLEK